MIEIAQLYTDILWESSLSLSYQLKFYSVKRVPPVFFLKKFLFKSKWVRTLVICFNDFHCAWSHSALICASAVGRNSPFQKCKPQTLSLLKVCQWFYCNKEIWIGMKPLSEFQMMIIFSYICGSSCILELVFKRVKAANYSSEPTRWGGVHKEVNTGYFFSPA